VIRSLRAQLALWHGGLLAVTLILLAGLIYLVLRQVLSSLADASLLDYADKTARQVAGALYQAETLAGTRPLTDADRDERVANVINEGPWGRFVQVDNPRGLPVAFSDALRVNHLPDNPEIRSRILVHRQRVLFTTISDRGPFLMRVVTIPVEMGERIPYIVRVGAPAEGVDEAIQRVSVLLLVLTPSIFVIALLGGWLLVGRALKPVDDMTRAALSIESKRLDVRLVPLRTDDEIGRLASALNEMIARLDRSFRQIERFTADASHELKTPLTTIRGEAEVALMGDLQPEHTKATLHSIVEETERLSEIVNNLLLLSRADAEQVRLNHEPIALDQVAMQAYETTERLAHRKNISLDIAAMEEITIDGDSLWLHQLITNLLHNAINYTPEGGKVTLSVTREPADAAFREPREAAAAPPPSRARASDRAASLTQGRPAATAAGIVPGAADSRSAAPSSAPDSRRANAGLGLHAADSGPASMLTNSVTAPPSPDPGREPLPSNSTSAPQPSSSAPATAPPNSSGREVAVIRVWDTGPGIPAEHLPHIFDRFYRVDSGRSREQGGSGLGLNIARWVVESHGGTIGAESEPGKGATFTARIPVRS